MNDEIKEKLIKDFNEILVKEFCTDWKEKRIYIELLVNSTPFTNLLDYITNLQQENEKYKKIFEGKERFSKTMPEDIDFIILLKSDYDRQEKDNQLELIDYKSRCEKAIEYIKTCNPDVDLNSMFLNENYISNYGANDLLNILNGGDE